MRNIIKRWRVSWQPKLVSNFSSSGKIHLSGADRYGFKTKHNLNNTDIIDIVGGIPSIKITKCELTLTPISEDVMKVFIVYKASGKLIAKVSRQLDFITMSIQNIEMRVFKEGLGICTNIIINQVAYGRKFGFKQIDLYAAGGVDYDVNDPDGDWQGYYHWPKYGFLLDTDSQKDFDKWITNKDRKEKNLWQLLQSKEGFELWRKEGESWDGYFDLSNRSVSMKRLKNYLLSKGINAPLTLSAYR